MVDLFSRRKASQTLGVLRDILILLFLGLLTWKLAISEIRLDLSDFQFSDFLSIAMAFFAIILSVNFYFKANDTAGKFYDNTYKFTQEVSVILGQIQAGFGKQLDQMEKNTASMNDKFDEIRHQRVETEEKVKDTTKFKDNIRSEFTGMIDSLIQNASMEEPEKEEFKKKLNKKEHELQEATIELNEYKHRLNNLNEQLENGQDRFGKRENKKRDLHNHLRTVMRQLSQGERIQLDNFFREFFISLPQLPSLNDYSFQELQDRLKSYFKNNSSKKMKQSLINYSLISEHGQIHPVVFEYFIQRCSV